MDTFVWVVVAVLALDITGKLLLIHRGETDRSVSSMAIDAVANTLLLCWGAALLTGAL